MWRCRAALGRTGREGWAQKIGKKVWARPGQDLARSKEVLFWGSFEYVEQKERRCVRSHEERGEEVAGRKYQPEATSARLRYNSSCGGCMDVKMEASKASSAGSPGGVIGKIRSFYR
jgi:hypothetical protein